MNVYIDLNVVYKKQDLTQLSVYLASYSKQQVTIQCFIRARRI